MDCTGSASLCSSSAVVIKVKEVQTKYHIHSKIHIQFFKSTFYSKSVNCNEKHFIKSTLKKDFWTPLYNMELNDYHIHVP